MDTTIEALEKARVGDVFRSRKNRVFRVMVDRTVLVAKIFPLGSGDRPQREYSILSRSCELGVRVPRPVKLDGRAILMEYIEGRSASAGIDSDPSGSQRVLMDVVAWLSYFHRAHRHRICRGDCVLHNFLLTGEGVVGVDFEESREGDPADDLGQVLASYLSMRPSFLEAKFEEAHDVASEYARTSGFDPGRALPRAVADALRHYAEFREDGPLLRTWADRIERSGLRLGQD